jgi:hypothetical protein
VRQNYPVLSVLDYGIRTIDGWGGKLIRHRGVGVVVSRVTA